MGVKLCKDTMNIVECVLERQISTLINLNAMDLDLC